MQIRIISTPLGDAPEQIRSAWVGVTLPLAVTEPERIEGLSVFSKPRTRSGLFLDRFLNRTDVETGYVVDASGAIELLAAHAPEAAQWWRQHAPQAVAAGEYFLFAAEVCQEVTP